MPAITVAMITLNEEQAVGKVIAEIQAATAGLDVEILVVDSSKDRTPEIAAAADFSLRDTPKRYKHLFVYSGDRPAI